MGRENFRKEKLGKPRNAFATSAFLRSGGGIHTTRTKHEPTVEEELELMAEEKEAEDKEWADLMKDMENDDV